MGRTVSNESWLIDWLTDWLIDWLIDWLTGWLIDWLIDWLVDWLIGWLTDWLITHNTHISYYWLHLPQCYQCLLIVIIRRTLNTKSDTHIELASSNLPTCIYTATLEQHFLMKCAAGFFFYFQYHCSRALFPCKHWIHGSAKPVPLVALNS